MVMVEKFKNGMSVGNMMLYPTFQLDEEEEDIGPDPTLSAGKIPADPKKLHIYIKMTLRGLTLTRLRRSSSRRDGVQSRRA